jgi:hypothetical protein
MMGGIDSIKRIFDTDIGPFSMIRNIGLSAFNAASPIKKFVASVAMGTKSV